MLSLRTSVSRIWRLLLPALLLLVASIHSAQAQDPPLLETLQLKSGSGPIGFAPTALDPPFESDITQLTYSISIPFEHDTVQVEATAVDPHTWEEPTIPTSFPPGLTTSFTIKATEDDPFSPSPRFTTYTINVTRGASNDVAVLSNLVISDTLLSPAFGQLTFGYSGSVSSDLTTVAVTPTAQSTTSTVTVNGTPITTESPSKSVTLTGEETPVVILVMDGEVTKAYSIDITQRPPVPDEDMDDMPDDYELANGLTIGINDALLDLDGDGLNNLGEYAFGSDPNDPSSHRDPDITRDGAGFLVISYHRAIDPSLGTYQVQVSSDLSTWTSDVAEQTNPGTPELQVWRDTNGGSAAAPPTRFARIIFSSSL